MNMGDMLSRNRDRMIREWIRKLRTEASPRYSARPIGEYHRTIPAAFDAYFAALVHNDYSRIDEVVEEIGDLRFRTGFTLSEVQKAFEIFGSLFMPVIVRELKGSVPEVIAALNRLDLCLNYTIHRFSDYFQALSEKQIRDYSQMLEIKVEDRTRELAESETKYRTLVEEIRDGYFVNRGGRIVFANKAFGEMHGYALKEVIGRPFTDFVAPQSMDEVTRLYERRVQEKESREHYVYNRLHRNGSSLLTENNVVLTVYEGEKAAIGICRDITERMEIEKRVREAENLAHIGQITTSLAHEVRNPLSSARMSIQMLLKNKAFTGNERRRLEILAQEVERLNRIVTEMLDFAKPVRYDFQPASVEDLLNSCLDVIETKIMEKDIVIRKSFSNKLPHVMMDPEKMEQAVINLLLNAVEAVGRQGLIRITVSRGKGKKQMVRVEITDNGPGIGPEDMPYIFDPFFSKKSKGTGLGLANAKKIIEAHGGTIRVVSALPRGMRVSFSIPAG